MALVGPEPMSFNPLRRLTSDIRAERRYRGAVPARRHIVQPQPHAAVRRVPAAGAARRVQALRARVHAADLPRQRRVHDRPRGQPLHDRLARLELQLARGPHGRPHAAAGRRPADDRRRLPPPLAADHAPRLPPRGDRSRRSRRWTTRSTARSTDGGTARGSTSTTRPVGSRSGSRCGRCSGSIPTLPAPGPTSPGTSSRGSASGRATTSCRCCGARAPRSRRCRRRGAALDAVIFEEIARRRRTGERGKDVLEPADRRLGRGRQSAHRSADPRRGDDAAVRRPRHDHLDGRVHVLRARPPARYRRGAARGAGPRARRRAARTPRC